LRAEIVAVGSELLLGDIADTNSPWLTSRLAEIGVDVHRHTVVGDNPERLAAALSEAAERADVVVVGGGLGPTQDDLTRFVVADLAGVALERHQGLVDHLEERFAHMGRPMPERNLVQCDLPVGARVLWPAGTAAGFTVTLREGTEIWCLPGPPWELHELAHRDLLPALAEAAGQGATISRLVRTAGIGESDVADRLGDLVADLEDEHGRANPSVAFLASGGEVRVRITAKATTREEAVARSQPVVDAVVDRLGRAVAGIDDEGPEHQVARLLVAGGHTLAVAESLTGGRVGERLVAVPGASSWFRGGLLCYATDLKATLGGVDRDLLAARGPVDDEVAAALARGAAQRCAADVGLGLVGVAGPEPQGDAEVGTVIAAVWDGRAEPATERQRRRQVPARTRVEIQRMASATALDLLRRVVAGDLVPAR